MVINHEFLGQFLCGRWLGEHVTPLPSHVCLVQSENLTLIGPIRNPDKSQNGAQDRMMSGTSQIIPQESKLRDPTRSRWQAVFIALKAGAAVLCGEEAEGGEQI